MKDVGIFHPLRSNPLLPFDAMILVSQVLIDQRF